ncbi:hypothetical protein GGI15_003358, partial [Coemansia interrupta]
MTPSDTERTLSRSHIVSRAQRLQTVAAEASDQLRDQTVQLLQAQSIRLEDIAETELESHDDLDQSLNEMMQCILYTELRKDVRSVADAIDDMQHRLYSSRQDMTNGQGSGDNSNDNNDDGTSGVDGETTPTQISTTETFRTACGVPMFSESLREEHAAQDVSIPISSSDPPGSRRRQKLPLTFSLTDDETGGSVHAASAATSPIGAQKSGNQILEDTREQLESLEHRLYTVCIEIHEWRRTQC